MDNAPIPGSQSEPAETAEPEVLKPRAAVGSNEGQATPGSPNPAKLTSKPPRHRAYRPSHKATFIGLGVVIAILAINTVIIAVVLKGKSHNNNLSSGQVAISSAALNKVGVNSGEIGNSGIELTVDPNAQFNGKLTVAGDVSVGGQLKINSTFTASDANLTQLEAGNTSLAELDVNGNSTLSSLALRNDLTVTGTTQFQGAVTIGQLLTLDNDLNVTGNVSIGGDFSAKEFSANSLTSASTLTIQGHVITGGSSPSVGPGGTALGTNGTVSISGDDSAGAIAINLGVSAATSGLLAKVAFATQFSGTPRVIISPVNFPDNVVCGFYVESLSTSGFDVADSCTSTISPGGYTIDYIVDQ